MPIRTAYSLPAPWWLALLLVCTTLRGHAQVVNTIRFTPNAALAQMSGTFQAAPGGGWWLGGQVSFRSDSAHLRVVRLGADVQIVRERQARLPDRRGSYKLRALRSTLCFGGNVDQGVNIYPFVGALDTTTFATRWAGYCTNAALATELVAQGPDTLVVYMMRRPSTFVTHLIRGWTDAATGTRWRGREIPFPVNQSPRVDGITVEGPRGLHYAYGRNSIHNSRDVVFLMKLDTNKVYWERQIDPGGDDEELEHVKLAANGDLLTLFNTQIYRPAVVPDEAIFARFDTAGNLLNARRITATGRYLSLSSLAELPNGDLVLAGTWRLSAGSTPHPIMVRLDAAGNVVWARRWNLGTSSGGTGATIIPRVGGRYALAMGNGDFAELDADFNACQFLPEPAGAVVATPGTLIVTAQTLSMQPFTPILTPRPLLNRSMSFARSVVCTTLATEEEAAPAANVLAAWPQPLSRGERLRLALPTGWAPADTRLTLTSALGQVVWRGPWADALTLPVPAGVWLLTATDARAGRQQHHRLVVE